MIIFIQVFYNADDVFYENRNMLQYIYIYTVNIISIVATDCCYFFIVGYIYIYLYTVYIYICTVNIISIVVTDCSYLFIVAYIYIYIYIHIQ